MNLVRIGRSRTCDVMSTALKSYRHLALKLTFFALAGCAAAQQGTGPAAPPLNTERPNYEGKGDFDFLNTCSVCHGRIEQAPPVATLQKLSPEKIYETITIGSMKSQAANLTNEQKVKIAEWVSGRRLGTAESGDAKKMPNVCPSNLPVKDVLAPSWNGWSPNSLTNTRYQAAHAADLSPAAASRLQLKWAFGLPGTYSAYGQPTIAGGRVLIGSDSGYLYSLDAVTGCVHWSFQAQAGLRSTPMIAPTKAGSIQMAAFIGDIRGNVYSIDASSGELLWKISVDPHPLARIMAAVKVYEGRVYVPVANLEETGSAGYDYLCCTSRGILVALDAATGRQIWKTYTISETPSPRKTSMGVNFMGPSGASVWGTIALDPKRQAVYLSTGNAFSEPDVGRSDAVMAMDMKTGKILWVQQAEHGDVWHNANCSSGPPPAGFPPRSAARIPAQRSQSSGPGQADHRSVPARPPPPPHYYCPEVKENPDWDFSAGVMLVELPNGKNLVVAGQKSGVVWAFDPDQKGALVWKSDISRGEITFGAAADEEYGYFGMKGGALAAIRLKDGVEQWNIYIDPQPSMESHRGVSAAVSLVPGAVFVCGLDGTIRAFSTFDGRPLWQYDTTQEVKTVNGVPGKGGSIGSAGAIVVHGMVYVTSGYIGFQNGQPGNLLLAFGPPNR
jgi:polyvinyl alcohol dehydrogenase (cytochrome)